MSQEAEYRNFEHKPRYGVKFDWAVGRKFELWISVDNGKLKIRTEITHSPLPSAGGEEDKSNENN
jgi:hypothetical protein